MIKTLAGNTDFHCVRLITILTHLSSRWTVPLRHSENDMSSPLAGHWQISMVVNNFKPLRNFYFHADFFIVFLFDLSLEVSRGLVHVPRFCRICLTVKLCKNYGFMRSYAPNIVFLLDNNIFLRNFLLTFSTYVK
jgi:hypothetical protein